MEGQARPFVRQMIKEAVAGHGNKSTNCEVRDWIMEKYPGVSANTILNQIIVCTVNHEARIHYRENQRPRRCNDIYDFLFRPSSGKIEMYDPRLHGAWEIVQDEKGILSVREAREERETVSQEMSAINTYIEAPHLRSYLAKNLSLVEEGLELYVDIFGNIGVEYPTEFGAIDILAVDKSGAFVIVEVKQDPFPDASSGQILKFKNWVKRNIALGKPVRSYLVGPEISEHIRYSLAECTDVFLKQYALTIKLHDVPKITDMESPDGDPTAPIIKKQVQMAA